MTHTLPVISEPLWILPLLPPDPKPLWMHSLPQPWLHCQRPSENKLTNLIFTNKCLDGH